MKNPYIVIALAAVLVIWAAGPVRGSDRTWVFFADKGYQSPEALKQALEREEGFLLPRTKDRLLKVRSAESLLSETDLPIFPGYLQEIRQLTGLEPHAVCRVVNAASYTLNTEQIRQVQSLPFVRETRPVRKYQREPDVPSYGFPAKQGFRTVQDSLFYGGSYLQNALENFPPAHEAGYTGAGVLVGMLDAGWNNLAHVCFDSLEIVATWDFVNGDSSVANDPGQMGDGSHGTKTLSCLAGYDPGNLIGTSYDISVALAKTENTESERHIEEDNWAAGIEWLDSLGCTIVTSSVSYYTFDPPQPSYTYEDLDGNTAIVTIAGDNAVARGVVVLNSAGNRGSQTYPENKMTAPGDGDSVMAIGAVNADSTRASFSSLGPTYDGRIKPDLMALGVSVRVASAFSQTNYTPGSGTSFSTPITAGACALLLQADPALTPMQVQEFLKATGDQASDPDTLRGWGIYDVWQAIQDVLLPVAPPQLVLIPDEFLVFDPYPNPFNATVLIAFALPVAGEVNFSLFSPDGRLILTKSQLYSAGYHKFRQPFDQFSSGVYFCRISASSGQQVVKITHLK